MENSREEIIEFIRDQMKGVVGPAVVNISGGKDCYVVAKLCVEALGKENVIGLAQPDGFQIDLEDARFICNSLGINYDIIDIGEAVHYVWLASHWSYQIPKGMDERECELVERNIPPRVRMIVAYYIAQCLHGRVVNTSNLSETYIGWTTKWGDNVGDFAPIKHLTATEVIQLGREMGLDERILSKAPADGLCGTSDEEQFGFTYAKLDSHIRNPNPIVDTSDVKPWKFKIEEMHERSRHKRVMPPTVKTILEDGDKNVTR